MKDYSQHVFLSLDPERQVRVSLELLKRIEIAWGEERIRLELIEKLKFYLSWMSHSKDFKKMKPGELLKSIETGSSLRKILNIATAFERKLSVSLKDDSILVRTDDTRNLKKDLVPLCLVLDNLRSAHNVGSIFRTADCFGVKHVYLVGYTATPEDLSVQKTAMGTETCVSWSHVEKIEDLMASLREQGVKLAALETADGSVPISKSKTQQNLALFLGNERFGLEPKHLKDMDHILEIPMKGRKNSLNVSNACAVAVFEISRSWGL